MRYSIGLDMGTTHIKACLTDETGAVLAITETDNEQKETERFGRCFLPEELFEKAVYCIRSVTEKTGCMPDAIGITSMAESGVFLDEKDTALIPVIPWGDGNGTCFLPETLCGRNLYQKTGLIWHPKYTVNRILTLKKEYPDIYERISCFLSISDYILYRLTGTKFTDESLACRTGMYDIVNRCYWSEMTEFAGMTGKLPEVIYEEKNGSSSEQWPFVDREAATLLGLSGRVQVRVCGHDHLCAAEGEGLLPDEVFNSMGTSEIYAGWLEELNLNEECYERGIQQGRFGAHCYWICNMPSSGASVEWFRNLLSMQEKISYEELMEQKGQIPSPVLYLPFINGGGTHRKQEMTKSGGFLGITSGTGRGDILQGIYEGIAMESRMILSQVQETGRNTTHILTVGGGSRNRRLMQTKADVTGSTYFCSSNVQATAIGAAAMAGGFSAGNRAAGEQAVPRAEYKAAYAKKYEYYRRLL